MYLLWLLSLHQLVGVRLLASRLLLTLPWEPVCALRACITGHSTAHHAAVPRLSYLGPLCYLHFFAHAKLLVFLVFIHFYLIYPELTHS